MKLKTISRAVRQWFSNTPNRSLDRAYKAALTIKAIEDEYFNGQKISAEFSDQSESVITYFQAEFNKYFKIVKMRLAEFKASRSLLIVFESEGDARDYNLDGDRPQSLLLEQLKLIEEVISKYEQNIVDISSIPVASVNLSSQQSEDKTERSIEFNSPKKSVKKTKPKNNHTYLNTVSDKTSILPRSLFRTLNRIKRDILPRTETEAEVLKNYRESRNKTAISIKFLVTLIIVPFLIHQVTKNVLIRPIVERYFSQQSQVIFVNSDLEEEAFSELQKFEERLHFRTLTGLVPEMSPEEIEARVKKEANKIIKIYRSRGADAISNIFADIFSLIAFAIIIFVSKREIIIVKAFLDEIVYGLSDSAKAFLIILLTDMFVGYHSPHGWEIILESVSRHFGIPENREFNFLFIATFPVILDTILKYWIFRYLNRISPSSVATYKNMNQ